MKKESYPDAEIARLIKALSKSCEKIGRQLKTMVPVIERFNKRVGKVMKRLQKENEGRCEE